MRAVKLFDFQMPNTFRETKPFQTPLTLNFELEDKLDTIKVTKKVTLNLKTDLYTLEIENRAQFDFTYLRMAWNHFFKSICFFEVRAKLVVFARNDNIHVKRSKCVLLYGQQCAEFEEIQHWIEHLIPLYFG